jgi:ABC-type lipoprotein export system ATPase subunit
MSQTATQVVVPSSKSERPLILRAQGIKKTYETGRDVLQILKHVDLTLREGEFVAIEGKSGSGKSTLLHIMGGLDVADSGTLEFDGKRYAASPKGWLQPTPFRKLLEIPLRARTWVETAISLALLITLGRIHINPFARNALIGITVIYTALGMFKMAERALLVLAGAWVLVGMGVLTDAAMGTWWLGPAIGLTLLALFAVYLAVAGYIAERPICELRTRSFGFVFQFYHLLPELNVLENAMMPSMVEFSWLGYLRQKAALKARAKEVLADVGLSERLRHKPSELSGGERQRVAIARALMNQPRVLFADEPTGNLDVETGGQIMAVLEKLHRERRQTIVMVTHDRSVASKADRVLVLRSGRLERPGDLPEPDKTAALSYQSQ